jgi:hypothetical protein
LPNLGANLEQLWVQFYADYGMIWCRFWDDFDRFGGRFWADFGADFESDLGADSAGGHWGCREPRSLQLKHHKVENARVASFV